MITDRIINFLNNRGWQVVLENDQYRELVPPANFGLPQHFRVTVPRLPDKVDFERYYNNLLQIFSDFYYLNKEDLNLILDKEDTVLKVRIYDDSTTKGTIGFLRFEGFIERLKAILMDTASFVIDKNVTSTRVPAEALRYLNKCHFLQTEKGSYVTKIQLPSKELIKNKELFDRDEIYAEEINEKLNEVLAYVNNQIFTNTVGQVNDEYIIENEAKINLKLLKDIEVLYDKSELKNIDFSFHNIEESKTVESKNVTKEQINRLSLFIEEVSNRAVETKEVEVRGVINLLKSKDPDGLKNSVTMSGIYSDMPVVATANLSSDDYKEAIEAHKVKEYVTIAGLAKTTKTRIRFLRIDSFTLG